MIWRRKRERLLLEAIDNLRVAVDHHDKAIRDILAILKIQREARSTGDRP